MESTVTRKAGDAGRGVGDSLSRSRVDDIFREAQLESRELQRKRKHLDSIVGHAPAAAVRTCKSTLGNKRTPNVRMRDQ